MSTKKCLQMLNFSTFGVYSCDNETGIITSDRLRPLPLVKALFVCRINATKMSFVTLITAICLPLA